MTSNLAPAVVETETAPGAAAARVPQLSIISPAYHERDNIRPLVTAVATAMQGVRWELIIVDDDSSL